MSFWQCPTDALNDVEEAALAIATGREHIEKLDIVWLDDEELKADGQILRNTKGRTAVTNMASKHVDAARLDYARLGKVARRVVDAIEANRYRRFTRARVKRLIEDALEQGRIDKDALHEGLRAGLTS